MKKLLAALLLTLPLAGCGVSHTTYVHHPSVVIVHHSSHVIVHHSVVHHTTVVHVHHH